MVAESVPPVRECTKSIVAGHWPNNVMKFLLPPHTQDIMGSGHVFITICCLLSLIRSVSSPTSVPKAQSKTCNKFFWAMNEHLGLFTSCGSFPLLQVFFLCTRTDICINHFLRDPCKWFKRPSGPV